MNASLTNALADLTQPSATTTLDGTAKKLQVDADYRVELGSVAKVWTDLAGALSKIHQDGLAPENVESVMYIFRIVRNMVAGVTPNQDRARSAKVPDLIQELISQAAHTHYGNSAFDETDPPVSQETVEFLTQVFVKVSGLTVEIFKTLDKPGVGQHGVEDLANVSSGLILLLGCFAHMSLYEDGRVASENNAQSSEGDVELDLELPAQLMPLPDWFKAQHMAIVQGGVVESAIELLRQADTSLARVTKPVAAMPNGTASTQAPSNTSNPSMTANTESSYLSNTSTTQGQQSFFVGLKRDIVRLVGNLAYRSRHVQDRIRNCNGLIVMLSQCNIDDANPFLREYAILAMKNILTGNVENQALIEELQPIEAVDHPALQEARVTSRLDDQGRPVLSQQKP
ncbi:hypothetical protein BGZ52_012657 [Haplosporangium bisporale]|nr:hypothetical protein BGZ52_012657 [Haplosporangium bisporale]